MMVQSCRRAARLGTAGVPASEMTGIRMDEQTKGGSGGVGVAGRTDPQKAPSPPPFPLRGRGEGGGEGGG